MILKTILFMIYMWGELLLLMVVWLRVQWMNRFSPREKRDAFVDKTVRNWARRLLFLAGAKVDVQGTENIPTDRVCVFASNHQSFFDILLLLGVVNNGYSAIIFPEGTRSKTGEVGEFKGGAFKVAQKTGAPIVPVALDGTAALFERNGHWIKSGNVKLRILPPIETEGMGRNEFRELPAKTEAAICEALQ